MSFVMLGVAVVAGGTQIAMALSGAKKRKEEQIAANAELAKRKAAFEGLDTSNPYANLENAYEDLTVNQQQAQFVSQQNAQNQANIMQGLQGAAGGSGVAGLAQAMANQGQLQSQAASASIGNQEKSNTMAAAKGEMAVQMAQGKGKYLQQGMEKSKISTLWGAAQGRRAAADAARQHARNQVSAGIGTIAGGVGGAVGKGMTGGQGGFWDNMRHPGEEFGNPEFQWNKY